MNKVIKIHGCSGAGKTTVVRSFMTAASKVKEIVPHESKNGRPEAYVCEFQGWSIPVCILGSYKNNCGGMDSYPSDAGSIIKLIDFYKDVGHIIFEGLLLSTYYGTVGKHLEKIGDRHIMAFMDTPLMTCLERVTHRRDVQGSKNKFNPQNTVDKFNTIEGLKNKSIAAGRRVVMLQHDTDPVPQLQIILRDAA